MIYLKFLPNLPELFLHLPVSGIAELAKVLVNGSSSVDLTHLSLHFSESQSHLNAITPVNKFEGSFEELPRSCHAIVFGGFSDLQVKHLIAIFRILQVLASSIVNFHCMVKKAKVFFIVCEHKVEDFCKFGRDFV